MATRQLLPAADPSPIDQQSVERVRRTDWRAAGVGAAWGAGIAGTIGLIFPYERWRRVIH